MNQEIHPCGIVLAAGASSRMGSPKSLLKLPTGTRLADEQHALLHRAGCNPTKIILGAEASTIVPSLTSPTAINSQWKQGRITSIQCGLNALPESSFYIVLPVDAVGIQQETIETLLRHPSTAAFVRPMYQDNPGHILRVSPEGKELLLKLPQREDVQVNQYMKDQTEFYPCDDAAVINNINAPDEWETWLKS